MDWTILTLCESLWTGHTVILRLVLCTLRFSLSSAMTSLRTRKFQDIFSGRRHLHSCDRFSWRWGLNQITYWLYQLTPLSYLRQAWSACVCIKTDALLSEAAIRLQWPSALWYSACFVLLLLGKCCLIPFRLNIFHNRILHVRVAVAFVITWNHDQVFDMVLASRKS